MVLKDKVAVVTGAAGTMGLAAAKFLLEDGAKVALVDVDMLRLDNVGRFLRGTTLAVSCDISDSMAVRQAHQKIAAELGPVDILVNNAGILSNNKSEGTLDDEWKRVMGVNLDGAFFWSRAVLPGMKARQWGRIINVCSLAAKTGGLTAGTAYSTSKGALTSLTFSLAREAAAHGVTVNGISPAYVKTPMITEGLNEQQRRQLLTQIPVGRFCEPEEFAHAVRFLASPLAGFITGEILDVNGGLQMD
ncbi:SDR family NAD(P)-dependent oxidoreductase [Usitatibacter palustris]|uniref:3-oxoacyl-[acyl-carrier-protein] reductase FabG n=1 Tax=Usitatibacter palustris TaxID=2732487 RepID=A0A6M4H8J6_9PROT|nr:SDR family NAD(P)-dependent oxidoreductase [Usitatibacter palustris]QJR14327.1 3-oxoacyl-[acyl-carrier-protein] reductase FabG [Usitatibacter palustris]